MPNGQSVPIRQTLPRRIKVGIGATVLTLVILVFPGQLVLPLSVLTPLMPRMGGCANFGIAVVGVAFFGFAILLSFALIGFGIVAIVATARRNRFGLVGAVSINAVVISLLLMVPLDFSPSPDPGAIGLYVLLAIVALVPATAMVLLLSPTVFASWWKSSRPFLATAVAAGLLLLPGAAGAVALGFQVSGISSQPAATVTTAPGHVC